MSLIKSRKRVAEHGEVFTPPWLVETMLDLVADETDRIDARFLEPACGSGNFLVRVLQRKLAAVEVKFGKSDFEKKQYALLGLMCVYGVELLADNISECRANLMEVFCEYLGAVSSDDITYAASTVLSYNLIHGDALNMKKFDGHPIIFSEWGYLGRGKFQKRDFRLDVLTRTSELGSEDLLSAKLGSHDVFTPVATYPPLRISDLADLSKTNDKAEA